MTDPKTDADEEILIHWINWVGLPEEAAKSDEGIPSMLVGTHVGIRLALLRPDAAKRLLAALATVALSDDAEAPADSDIEHAADHIALDGHCPDVADHSHHLN